MGKLIDLPNEIKAKELLSRRPTPEEMATLCGVPVDAVLAAMAYAVRKRHPRLRQRDVTRADIAAALGLTVERLAAACDASPCVPDKLRRWVAHHAWRPVSLRHAARLAGVARGTAATIAHGRVRPEQDELEVAGALKPRKTKRYYCPTCEHWVYLTPCVICEAMKARYPEEGDDERKAD